MIAMPPGFLQPHGGAGGDPFFSNVVLLLHGSDFLDYSSHAFVASSIGGGVTIDSSIPNASVGNDCFRVTGVGDTTFQFPACPQFKRVSTYTLEYWVYFDAVASNNLAMCSNFGTKFLQFLNTSPTSGVTQQGWGANVPQNVSINAWHQVTLAYDAGAGKFAIWIDAGATAYNELNFSLPSDATDQDMDVISALGTGGQHRMMEIRYTQGVCRYNTASATIPAQTAPWPDSA